MLNIEKVDHIGIRISDKSVSIPFYQILGFELITDIRFEKGHPIIMQHPSGVVLNLLGPTSTKGEPNVLMDIDAKHPGITHVAYKVASLDDTRAFLAANDIAISGQFNFQGLEAVFIRDPDKNVIELDAYKGQEPGPRQGVENDGYNDHL